MNKYLASLLLLITCTYTEPKPMIAMALEKITPYRTNIGGNFQALKAFVNTAPKIYWNHPRLIVHTPFIIKRGFAIASELNGMDNLVHTISKEIEQKGWAQLTQVEKDAIVKIIVAPIKPNIDVIKKMQILIDKGYNFILATNQATAQHRFYKETMRIKFGLSINDLCKAGTITAPTYHDSNYNDALPFFEIEPNWLVASNINPSEPFCKALRELANRQESNAPIYMVHTFKRMLTKEEIALFEIYNITLFNSIDELMQAIEKQ